MEEMWPLPFYSSQATLRFQQTPSTQGLFLEGVAFAASRILARPIPVRRELVSKGLAFLRV